MPAPERDILLALPGLVRALVGVPGARLDIDVLHACALVMATPSAERLPREPNRDLTDQVADTAASALRATADQP